MVDLGPLAPVAPREPLFVSWIEMESSCGCLSPRCRHRRRVESENAERRAAWQAQQLRQEQIAALTDEDRAWLARMGWEGR